MNQIVEFFQKLLDTSDFPPRWHCGQWSEFHGWLYIISDLLIWSAYFAIPTIILWYVSRRKDARFVRIYFLFAAFILACGATHFFDAIIFWYPVYRLSALVRLFTGIISWVTVFSLIRLLPTAFSLKTSAQLEEEVTRRRKAEEELRVNNELLNEAQQIAKLGHWRWNLATKEFYWSDTMKEIYGIAANEQVTFDTFFEKLHPDDRPIVDEVLRIALDKKVFHEYYHRLQTDGVGMKTIHVRGQVIAGNSGEALIVLGTAQDVTEQRKVQQELLAKSQELEATNIELQKFASVASHDLREPLRKIISFASLLEKEYKQDLGDKGRFYLNKITSASARMQHLIDDILDFSRLSERGYVFSKVQLNYIVDAVLSDMEVLISSTGAEVIVDKLPEIEVNAGQIGRLFQNLIANALKFHKDNERPVVKIGANIVKGKDLIQEQAASGYNLSVMNDPTYWEHELFCRITVADNGIGFDESYLDRIFLIFQRLHGRTEYEGTGIGLAVCKKVADIHHGYITAESRLGEGATFIVVLPVSQRNFTAE